VSTALGSKEGLLSEQSDDFAKSMAALHSDLPACKSSHIALRCSLDPRFRSHVGHKRFIVLNKTLGLLDYNV
jgi:hypothetical protein